MSGSLTKRVCIGTMLATLAVVPSAWGQQQFRCIWATLFDPGFRDASEIDTLVNTAVQGHYNVIMPELMAYQDNTGLTSHGAFWKSNIVPWSPAVTSSFDPLAYLIQQAHAQNIEVHGWIVPFRTCTTWPPAGNTRLAAHDEYLSVRDTDIDTGPKPVSGAYTLDPGSPDVQDYLMDILREIVTNYAIDGINLDYIRYEKTNAGYPARSWYTKSSLARFKTITNYSGTPPASGNTSWDDFRRRSITEIVRRARAEIASVRTNPRQPVRLTADLIVYGDAPSSFASTDAYGLFQNWQFWMQQGYLDGGMPMDYRMEHCSPQDTWYRNWVNRAVSWKYNRHMYMGHAGYLNSKENSVAQMEYALANGCEGIASYSYYSTVISSLVCSGFNSPNDPTFYTYVRDNLFGDVVGTPTMPWRSPATATEGTIWGRVTDAMGTPVDDATVRVGDQSGVQTDGSGYYVVTLVPATATGTNYRVIATRPGHLNASNPAATVTAGDIARYDFQLANGVPGDYDADGDVDLQDFGVFQNCLTGPTGPPTQNCLDADLDHNNNVDGSDLAKFMQCMTGPEIPGSLTCAD